MLIRRTTRDQFRRRQPASGAGETDTAKELLLFRAAARSEHVGAYNNLGVLALQENRWEMASRFFRHALEYAS
jgi:uncharacterized protein HemY